MADVQRRAHVFKALSDPLRLAIVEQLAGGPRCVCDIRDELDVAGNLLSHHLKVLREAGLVNTERDGRWVVYALDEGGLAQARDAVPEPRRALAKV